MGRRTRPEKALISRGMIHQDAVLPLGEFRLGEKSALEKRCYQ
jgi:hypothetical protein